MSGFKASKAKSSPFGGKDAKSSAPKNNDQLPPIFSFEHMAGGNGYSVECCNDDHCAALSKRFFLLSKKTWLEIKQAPRHGIGSEKIARRSIKPAIPNSVTDDVELIALRYNGLHPMVGYRDGRVFHVIFLDHTMDVYPH